MDYNARFYSPTLGRFTQPDTIIPDMANPQSWNRYSYAINNPTLYNDPDGRCAPACALPLIGLSAGLMQGVAALGAAAAAVVASPVFLVAVAVVAIVAVGVAVYTVAQAKSGEPSIKHRKDQTDMSTIGQTVDSPNGPVLRGDPGGKWCPGVKGKLFCGSLIGVGLGILLNLPFGDGAIGEDESLAPGWTPASPTSKPSSTPTSTSTSTSTPTSTSTSTPILTPFHRKWLRLEIEIK